MNDFSVKSVLKKNVMTIALFGIYVLFVILAFLLKSTNMLEPSIVSSLIEQNAYVFVLGAGMLMCMLTGGNIDLSVGSVVCFVGAIVGLFSVENRIIHMPLSVPVVLLIAIGVGVAYGSLLGLRKNTSVDCNSCRLPRSPRTRHTDPHKGFRDQRYLYPEHQCSW